MMLKLVKHFGTHLIIPLNYFYLFSFDLLLYHVNVLFVKVKFKMNIIKKSVEKLKIHSILNAS